MSKEKTQEELCEEGWLELQTKIKTYDYNYTCNNCREEQCARIHKGQRVFANGLICDNCGCSQANL